MILWDWGKMNKTTEFIEISNLLIDELQCELDKRGYFFPETQRNYLANIIFNFLDDEAKPFFEEKDNG